MLIVYDETARRLGEETRREAGQRCSFRRGGHGRVGFGEFDFLGFKGYSGILQDIVIGQYESKKADE